MTLLTIHPDDRPDEMTVLDDPTKIARKLDEVGVLFERWTAEQAFTPEASQEDIISAYQTSVNRLIDRYEFQTADVVSVRPDHPQKSELRAKFLNEHTHAEFEVRFFVEGRGLFYLHIDKKVWLVLCEKGDLLSVPAGVKHWFDMGENPDFKCIRLFSNPEGWVAHFTGDPIAERFPTFEQFLASHA
jgi:1,2-dihydroxy-3-keto-5-methylthiopentene dioxygenase